MRKSKYFLLLIITLFSCKNKTKVADIIISNATIWTGNEAKPYAHSMAIAGDKIVSIGLVEDVMQFKGKNTTIIDLKGSFVTPGFIDSHVHLMTGGRSLLSVDLRDAKTPEEFSKRVGDFAATIASGEWILEGNWDHTLWGGELPDKNWIDERTSENPVLIMRLDWHMALANSRLPIKAGLLVYL